MGFALLLAFLFLALPAYAVQVTITDLGTLPGYSGSSPEAINASGQVVGWSEDSSGDSHAVLWSPAVAAPLKDEAGLIMTTRDHSNFAAREYNINHNGVDLALSSDGSATASPPTANKTVYAICDGTVEFSYSSGIESFVKIHHPNCNGHDVIAYYGDLNPTVGGTVSEGYPIGSVKCRENTRMSPPVKNEPTSPT
jgi:probable HAF family extracellular repeat protein